MIICLDRNCLHFNYSNLTSSLLLKLHLLLQLIYSYLQPITVCGVHLLKLHLMPNCYNVIAITIHLIALFSQDTLPLRHFVTSCLYIDNIVNFIYSEDVLCGTKRQFLINHTNTMSFGDLLYNLPVDVKKNVRAIERIQTKIAKNLVAQQFNVTCLNENLLPKYTNIYIYIYI